MLRCGLLIMIVVLIGPGCQSDGPSPSATSAAPSFAPSSASGGPVLAYVAGEPLRSGDLFVPMAEAVGGEILGERVLDEMLGRRLAKAGIELTPEVLEAERVKLSQTLSPDEDEAARLLAELRQRRGLGDVRFAALLRRNAGLRAIVADRVTVSEAAVEQAYRLSYGPASRVRLILAESLRDARDFRKRAN